MLSKFHTIRLVPERKSVDLSAAEQSSKALDHIILTSDISDICDDHKHEHIAISSDNVKSNAAAPHQLSSVE